MFSTRSFIFVIGLFSLLGCSAKLQNPSQFSASKSTCGAVEGYPFFGKEACFETVNEKSIMEGDIIVKPSSADNSQKRTGVAITGLYYRWPNGVVPYVISPELRAPQFALDAIAHFHANTPIRFRPKLESDSDYVEFIEAPVGAIYCGLSQVGRRGGRQEIELSSSLGCGVPTAIHEIGHAIGLWHEQTREDRDKYIKVDFSNIDPEMAYNFTRQVLGGNDIGEYDYESIMHYDQYSYALDYRKPTMITKDKSKQDSIGHALGLSDKDILTIYNLYGIKLEVVERSSTAVTIKYELPASAVSTIQVGESATNLKSRAVAFTARSLPNGRFEYRAVVDGLRSPKTYYYRVEASVGPFNLSSVVQKFDTDFTSPTIFGQSVRWDYLEEEYVAEWFTTEPASSYVYAHQPDQLIPDFSRNRFFSAKDDFGTHHKAYIPLVNLGRGEKFEFEFFAVDRSGNYANMVTTSLTTPVLPPILSRTGHSQTADKMYISWTSDIPGNTVVRYGQYSLSERIEFNDSETNHFALIRNLKPYTHYFVRVETTDPVTGLRKKGQLLYLRTTDLVRISETRDVAGTPDILTGVAPLETEVFASTSHPIGTTLKAVILDTRGNIIFSKRMKSLKPFSKMFRVQLPKIPGAAGIGVISSKDGIAYLSLESEGLPSNPF